MIDSVSFWLPGVKAQCLEDVTEYRADYYRGSLGNMRITQYPDGVYCTGSLATFLQGGNALPLTRRALGDALGKLEEKTGWDLKRAELYQVEVGTTLQVKYSPCLYLRTWGTLPRFVKHTYQRKELETVTYATGGRSFTGYDKRKQAENTGQEIPIVFSGAELLRLELKYKRGLKARMGRALTPWDLSDRGTYEEMVKHWQAFYFKIPKGRVPVLDITGGVSPKDLEKVLTGYGLQSLGYEAYEDFIAMLEGRGLLGRVQASRARKAAREVSKAIRISKPDEMTEELDSKVREVAVYAR